MRPVALPRLVISDGSLEALKLIALGFMTGDHINKYLFNGTKVWLYCAGRVAMPLFVFVLAYNLARPDALVRSVYRRTVRRLVITGCVATPVFVALGGLVAGWWPLNIMFALAAIAGMLFLLEHGTAAAYTGAVVFFLVAGSSVEFWWPALVLGAAVWSYCKRPSRAALALTLAALGALWLVSGNLWALAAVPVVVGASSANLTVPRLRWFFYVYYPGHLAALWLIRIPMSKAGYLFF